MTLIDTIVGKLVTDDTIAILLRIIALKQQEDYFSLMLNPYGYGRLGDYQTQKTQKSTDSQTAAILRKSETYQTHY